MTTRLLIIHRQLVFAVTLKQALEQTGAYTVHAFTVPDAGLEYLHGSPQHVALVDFTLAGRDLVRQLRTVQRDLAIILIPRQPEALARELRVQGMIDQPFSAREIIPMIEDALAAIQELGETELSHLGQTEAIDSSPGQPVRSLDEVFGGLAGQNNPFDDDEAREYTTPPPTLPEFSTLDTILGDEAPSEIFEPPVKDGDTPAVPTVNSEAMRQFLATRSDTGEGFDSVLGNISEQPAPEPSNAKKLPAGSSFEDLVNSMRGESAHTPLPDRHQQFIDFILTGGMDVLLSEIEKAKTGPLASDEPPITDEQQSSQLFEKLAAEEPPMPALEESGTVGDLMLGVSDPGFRNVLAMMRGEEASSEEGAQPRRLPRDVEEAFAAFFDSQIRVDQSESEQVPTSAEDSSESFIFATDTPHAESESIPAQLILETALDESARSESFSLDELIANIDRQLARHRPEVRPLPSWDVRFRPPPIHEEKYIQEPDFLPEEFPPTTQTPAVQADILPQTPEPEVLEEFDFASEAAVEADQDELPPAGEFDSWDEIPQEWTEAEAMPQDTYLESPPLLPDSFFLPIEDSPDEQTAMLEQEWAEAEPPNFGMAAEFDLTAQSVEMLDAGQDNAYIAQIALSLTQVSLELTADATLLTHNGEVVAVAGQLLPDDIAALQAELTQQAAEYGNAPQIRFITLASNNKNYMLYSRRTEGEFTLSMVFADTMPLRDIRNQGKRLAEALAAVPEVPSGLIPLPGPQQVEEVEHTAGAPATLLENADETVALAPYTYVWLLRDPDRVFDEPLARMMVAGLRTQLMEKGWRVHQLDVHDEYIYLLADVPAETPAYEIIRELKYRSGEIARSQNAAYSPQTLWADSYLVLTPGRELAPDEITQFINFERML